MDPEVEARRRARISETMRGKAKSRAHREAIAAGVKRYWLSDEGQQVRLAIRAAVKAAKLAKRYPE